MRGNRGNLHISPVRHGAGHTQISRDRGGRFAGVGYLTLSESTSAPAEILPRWTALADTLHDAFTFDDQFRIGQCRHHREHHPSIGVLVATFPGPSW